MQQMLRIQIDDLLNFRLYRPTVVQFRRLENEAVIGGYRIPPQVIIITIQYNTIKYTLENRRLL